MDNQLPEVLEQEEEREDPSQPLNQAADKQSALDLLTSVEAKEIVEKNGANESLESILPTLKGVIYTHDDLLSGSEMSLSNHVYTMGRLLNIMKLKANLEDRHWLAWARKHIPLEPRTRQNYERLAAIQGVENHLYLRKSVILEIDKVLKPKKSLSDPIGDFLRKYELIDVLDRAHPYLWENRMAINTALALEKMGRAKLVVHQPENVRTLVERGESFSPAAIKNLVDGQKFGMWPDGWFAELLNGGNPSKDLAARKKEAEEASAEEGTSASTGKDDSAGGAPAATDQVDRAA